jgi:hypothetical protein
VLLRNYDVVFDRTYRGLVGPGFRRSLRRDERRNDGGRRRPEQQFASLPREDFLVNNPHPDVVAESLQEWDQRVVTLVNATQTRGTVQDNFRRWQHE